jgi:hypothetical protein
MAQLGGLGREMAGDLGIQPVLNLGSQMKDFDGHNGIPLQFRGPPKPAAGPSEGESKTPDVAFGDAYSTSR